MVNSVETVGTNRLRGASVLVAVYAAVTVGTVVALAVLSAVAPERATQEAWGHAVIVLVLAVVLVLRLRAARAGSVRARRAVGIVAAVLVVVNLVEAALPGVFPGWMRVEMVAIAVAMAVLVVLVRRDAAGARAAATR